MGIYLISMYTKSRIRIIPRPPISGSGFAIWQSDSFPQIGSFEQQNQFSNIFFANVALNVMKRWHISLFTTFFD